MGKDVIFDYSKAAAFIHEEEIAGIKAGVQAARETLVEKTGAGNDFLGWIDLPVDYDKEEFGRIKKAAEKIQKDSDVLLVIGIGPRRAEARSRTCPRADPRTGAGTAAVCLRQGLLH